MAQKKHRVQFTEEEIEYLIRKLREETPTEWGDIKVAVNITKKMYNANTKMK